MIKTRNPISILATCVIGIHKTIDVIIKILKELHSGLSITLVDKIKLILSARDKIILF